MWGLAERHRAAMEASRSRGIPLHEAESEEFGASQQAIGAYALGVWAFDVAVVESVLYQVQPQEHYSPESNKVMMCLHAARAMFPESPLCETIPLQADLVAEHGVHVDLSDSERGAA